MKIRDFMTQGVHTVRPDDTLDTAAGRMWAHDCGSLPVVDVSGRVIAMVTDRDVCMAAYTQGKRLSSIRVATAMSRGVVTCYSEDAPIAAERKMREQQVRRLPVMDNRGRLVGIVSLNDIALEAAGDSTETTRDLNPQELTATLAAICRHRNTALAVGP